MTCRHCQQPIERCPQQSCAVLVPGPCAGWRHVDGWHQCRMTIAEPEPGSLPVVESPSGRPEGEVA